MKVLNGNSVVLEEELRQERGPDDDGLQNLRRTWLDTENTASEFLEYLTGYQGGMKVTKILIKKDELVELI